MRYRDLIEASIPFGRLGNTSGLTFGFESEIILNGSSFIEEISLTEDMFDELGIDQHNAQAAYEEWLEDGNEGDMDDFIDEIGATNFLEQMDADAWGYGEVNGEFVRYENREQIIYNVVDSLEYELGINIEATTQDLKISDKDYTTWYLENDLSVAGSGEYDQSAEIISPVFHSYDEFKDALEKYFGWVASWDDAIYTNSTTGFHVNIGMKNAKQKIDPLKLILFSGEKWVAKLWRDVGNGYANELLPKLNTEGLPRNINDAKKYFKKFIGTLDEKYYAINFLTLMERGYVEFRPIGNADYEKRLPDILNHISRFIQLIQISSDPTLYRKEYAKKLGVLLGGGKASSDINLPMPIKLIKQWLNTLNLNQSSIDKIIKDDQIVIDADYLIRLAGYLDKPFPEQIIRILIKGGNITKSDYERVWSSDYYGKPTNEYAEKAHQILDPYFS